MKTKTVGLLALITVAEATIGVFVKLTGGLIPIHTLNFYALALAAIFLVVTMPLATGQSLRFPRGNLFDTALIGVLIATQISVFNFAMTLAPIANVVIFWSVSPFFVFIFSATFLDEPARRIYLLIFAVALVGIVIARPLEGGNTVGNLVALGDGAIYAAMVTYMRSEGKSEPGNDIAWSMLVAAILLSPAVLLFGAGSLIATSPEVGAAIPVVVWVAGLGVGSTGLAYFGISIVLRTINANTYSLVDVIVSPVVAAVLGYLLFGEVPAQSMIYGGALLLGAAFLLTREMAKNVGTRPVHASQSA